MKKTNFDLLLHRYLSGQLPENERKKMEAWLEVVKTKYQQELELTKDDEDRLFEKITSSVDTIADVVAFRPERPPVKKLFTSRWFQLAAAAVVLLGLTYGLMNILPVGTKTEYVTLASGEKHILNDGTIVWLEKGSELRYERAEGAVTRNVNLKGGALFEVAKDPANPFTITCGDFNVRVLGTSFRLKTLADNIELKVLTGRVNLSTIKDKDGADISAHESVTYTLSGKLVRHNMDKTEEKTLIAETQYDMAFENATMDLVVARLEKKFDITAKVENSDMLKCHITADFTDHSLGETLLMLSELIDITYKIGANSVTLAGSGCK